MSDTDTPALPPPHALLFLRRLVAEAVGTGLLVFAGCGAVVVENANPGALGGGYGISVVFGLIVAAMVFTIGHVSGAHINPAVSVAFAAMGVFPWKEVPAYIVSQLLGASAGALAVRLLIGTAGKLGATTPSTGLLPAVGLEVALTFVLMFVIAGVATDSRAQGQFAAIAVGLTVALLAMFGGPLTGASMNPARTLGPALVGTTFDGLWIYLTAPFAGAVAGAWTYQWIAWRPDLDRG